MWTKIAACSFFSAIMIGCATCQPITQTIPISALPPEVLRSITAGYPEAKIDSAEKTSAMSGSGYNVEFHVGNDHYTMNLMKDAL